MKYTEQDKWPTTVIQALLKGFRHFIHRGNAHAKSHNVEKTIANAFGLDSNALKSANASFAVTESLTNMKICLTLGWRSKFKHEGMMNQHHLLLPANSGI